VTAPQWQGPEDAARATAAARAAFPSWSQTPIKERLQKLDAFRHELVAAVDRCVEVVGRECDKTENDVIGEVFQIANLLRFLVKKAPSILKPSRRSSFPLVNKRAWVEFVPFGVVGVISPWNYPIVLPAAATLQALAAGNTVVQKPSEYATESARLLFELWCKCGGPPDVWHLVEGGPETGTALVKAKVDKISFTGGAEGGKAVLAAASESLTPALLELGGSDAMLVCPDAPMPRSAEGAVWGAFYNAGQSCIGVRRCFVHQSVAESFISEVLRQTAAISADDYGSIRTAGQIDKLKAAVEDAVAKGAKLAAGNAAVDEKRIMQPIVLTGVEPGMKVMTEELFGPLLSIVNVDSMDQAVEWANAMPHGLSSSVWSRDRNNARELARRLRSGGVVINDCLVHFAAPALPFGGVKESGFGRSHGEEGLKEFCIAKAFLEDRLGLAREFQWFSSKNRNELFRRFLGVLHPRTWTEAARSLFGFPRRKS
jgi:acyl-CoA reductase-like NAD-dependent aldehyde dehydrogenase